MSQTIREMLDDLNDLLQAHARLEDTTEQFGDFMDKHGTTSRRTRAPPTS